MFNPEQDILLPQTEILYKILNTDRAAGLQILDSAEKAQSAFLDTKHKKLDEGSGIVVGVKNVLRGGYNFAVDLLYMDQPVQNIARPLRGTFDQRGPRVMVISDFVKDALSDYLEKHEDLARAAGITPHDMTLLRAPTRHDVPMSAIPTHM